LSDNSATTTSAPHNELPSSVLRCTDFPAAGTYNYSLFIRIAGSSSGRVVNSRLFAREL
jgi:hypothetical protein